MVYKCISGLHTWIDKKDASKCCNGFRRELRVYPKPEEVDVFYGWYGYVWVKIGELNVI